MASGLPVDIDDQDDLKASEVTFRFLRKNWDACSVPTKLSWNAIRLHKATSRRHIPTGSGIYTILLQPGIVDHPACSHLMYVGKTKNIKQRFGAYLTREKSDRGRPKIRRFLYKYADHAWFCFTPVPLSLLASVEDSLIIAFLPPLNDSYPASIRKVIGAF